jgi:hypothetical protein
LDKTSFILVSFSSSESKVISSEKQQGHLGLLRIAGVAGFQATGVYQKGRLELNNEILLFNCSLYAVHWSMTKQ